MNSVYYVEDSISIQELVRHSLSEKFEVHTFNNCMEALTFIEAGNIPDIVITDLDTPVMTGFELLVKLKATDFLRAIPVMVLSGEESTDSRIKSLEAGADDYVVKPFNPLELQARINNILKRVGK